MSDRFVVTELEGYLGNSTQPGLSLWNRALVATYRTDGTEQGRNRLKPEAVRRIALEHADRLNARAGVSGVRLGSAD